MGWVIEKQKWTKEIKEEEEEKITRYSIKSEWNNVRSILSTNGNVHRNVLTQMIEEGGKSKTKQNTKQIITTQDVRIRANNTYENDEKRRTENWAKGKGIGSIRKFLLATTNKLMTDHLSFLMITLRQKFGISLDVLAIPFNSLIPTAQNSVCSLLVPLLARCCIQTFVFGSCQSTKKSSIFFSSIQVQLWCYWCFFSLRLCACCTIFVHLLDKMNVYLSVCVCVHI